MRANGPTRALWRLAAMFVVVAWATVASAENPAVAKARLADEEGRYTDVLSAVEDGLLKGDLNPDEMAELFRFEALAHAAFGDEAATIYAFRRLLGLRPSFVLPSWTAPKLQRLLEQARRDGPLAAPVLPGAPQPAKAGPPALVPFGAGAGPIVDDRRPARKGGWYRSGWVWGAVAMVAAGSVAVIVVTRDGGVDPKLGTHPLP